MIFDHETDEEVLQSRLSAEMELDKVYHAIPEWVHRLFAGQPLSEKVAMGFDRLQSNWTETFINEVQGTQKVREFLLFLIRKHGIDYGQEYWNFLISKQLDEKKKLEEKR